MSSSELRIAFAGAGVVAELHRAAIARRSDARLVALCDPDAALAQRRSREWTVPAFASVPEMVHGIDVDAVFVLCPTHAHEAVAAQAVDAGKHVLVEKPVADAAGCQRLADRSAAAGVVCMPGHNYAYQPEFKRLRRLIRNGSLGTVRAVWVTYVLGHTEELAARYSGIVGELLVHHSYLTYAMLGAPDRVHAGRMRPSWHELPSDDQAWMVWEYGSRASAHLFGSFAFDDDTADPWTFLVKVLGSDGGVTYSWRSASLRRRAGTHRFALPDYEQSYEHELDAFVRAIRGEPEAIASTIYDARDVASLLERVRTATGADRGVYVSGVFDLSAQQPK